MGHEGICIFSGDDQKKILAVCSEGHQCEVAGLVDYCKESGECVEITHVTSVDVTAAMAEETCSCDRVRRENSMLQCM